jgi:hypothetical protein
MNIGAAVCTRKCSSSAHTWLPTQLLRTMPCRPSSPSSAADDDPLNASSDYDERIMKITEKCNSGPHSLAGDEVDDAVRRLSAYGKQRKRHGAGGNRRRAREGDGQGQEDTGKHSGCEKDQEEHCKNLASDENAAVAGGKGCTDMREVEVEICPKGGLQPPLDETTKLRKASDEASCYRSCM